jgi:hypothetical protein
VKIGTKDFNEWVTNGYYTILERIVNAKKARVKPYFIRIGVSSGYGGVLAVENDNHLIATDEQKKVAAKRRISTTEINLEGKRVIRNIVHILEPEDVPPVPLLATSLWRVDNVRGEVKCIYILPPDKPMIEGVELESVSKVIFESAKGMPLFWNKN